MRVSILEPMLLIHAFLMVSRECGRVLIRVKRYLGTIPLRYVAIIMMIVTLIFPVAVITFGRGEYWYLEEEVKWVDMIYVFVLWIYYPPSGNDHPRIFGVEGYGWHVLNPMIMINTFFFWFLPILFALQVVRYCVGKLSKRMCFGYGVLSIMPGLVMGLLGYTSIVQAGVLAYSGPIPIALIVGIILMRYRGPWKDEYKTPWKEEEAWWEEKQANT